jgi:xanthine dehydrogenase accessory factor
LNQSNWSEMHWTDAVQQCQRQGNAYALITVLGCSGSTPRDQGSKMVVTKDNMFDTIGGGNLEFVVANKARELLSEQRDQQEIIPIALEATLGQCCGGNVTVLIETFAACHFHVALFGAGHIGKELIKILGALPCKVNWIDSRENLFPEVIPENVQVNIQSDPVSQIAQLPQGADVLILTHNHQLDYELTKAAINHGTLRHIGLIGSDTKAASFRDRLLKDGLSEAQISLVTCPVGLSNIPGKLPMEVAVSIAGELIAIEHEGEQKHTHRGVVWKDIEQSLNAPKTVVQENHSQPDKTLCKISKK